MKLKRKTIIFQLVVSWFTIAIEYTHHTAMSSNQTKFRYHVLTDWNIANVNMYDDTIKHVTAQFHVCWIQTNIFALFTCSHTLNNRFFQYIKLKPLMVNFLNSWIDYQTKANTVCIVNEWNILQATKDDNSNECYNNSIWIIEVISSHHVQIIKHTTNMFMGL